MSSITVAEAVHEPRSRSGTGIGWLGRLMSIAALAVGGVAIAAPPAIVSLPVTFQVENQNRTLVACLSDGRPYEIRGHLVGPASLLSGSSLPAVTTYLHGIGWGEFFWHFTANPQYDYASRMAEQGHVSLVYEQLGYGGSGRPSGLAVCYGSEATIVRQIVDSLRAGTYVVEGRTAPAPTFSRVALASHQAAALIAEPVAYSFRDFDIDALIVTGFSDAPLAFRPRFLAQAAPFFASCLAGGQRSDGATGPFFYQFFPVADRAFRDLSFTDAEASVIDQSAALRDRSPCGEAASFPQSITVDALKLVLGRIQVPVLLVNGLEDRYFIQPLGGNLQRTLFQGSNDVTAAFIAGSGHALPLERTAADFRQVMHEWLSARGF